MDRHTEEQARELLDAIQDMLKSNYTIERYGMEESKYLDMESLTLVLGSTVLCISVSNRKDK
jgi:hypothetical protein